MDEATKTEDDDKEYETKLVKKVHRVALETNWTAVDLVGMTEEHTKSARKAMKDIKTRMDEITQMNKAKNDVESLIFTTRDSLEYDEMLIKVSTDEEKDAIRAGLSEAEVRNPFARSSVGSFVGKSESCMLWRTGVDVGRPHAEGVQGQEQGARQAAQADPAAQVRTGSAPGGCEIRTGADCLHPGVHCQRDRDG